MAKLLCFFGFHKLERRGRFIEVCTRPECIACKIEDAVRIQWHDWRWDWSLFKSRPTTHKGE